MAARLARSSTWGLDTPAPEDPYRGVPCRRYPARWWELWGATITDENRRAMALCETCPAQTRCVADGRRLEITGMVVAGQAWFSGTLPPDKPHGSFGRRECVWCRTEFVALAANQKACTQRCGDSADNARRRLRRQQAKAVA